MDTTTANKAHAGMGAALLSGAVTKILNKILAAKYPSFWDADLGDALGTIIDAGLTWVAVYFTPGAKA